MLFINKRLDRAKIKKEAGHVEEKEDKNKHKASLKK